MKYNLKNEINLRRYSFEYITRILLRRKRKNNFIFQTNRFDNIKEIQSKYRFKLSGHKQIVDLLKKGWGRCDLIEFVLNNKTERVITNIIFYDVKTKVKNNRIEMCKSNMEFLINVQKLGYKAFIITVKLLEDWSFEINSGKFKKEKIRVYSRYKPKTVLKFH